MACVGQGMPSCVFPPGPPTLSTTGRALSGDRFAVSRRTFRLVRYDGRGFGLSDRDVGDISFATFERDLEAVVDALRLRTYALLGISQGAAIAIAHAARYPERVSKMVLHGGFALGRNKRPRRKKPNWKGVGCHYAGGMGGRQLRPAKDIQLWLASGRSACRAGRGRLRDDGMRALSDRVVAVLARERGLAAGGRVIEFERLEFVGRWRCDREVAVGPAIGRRQYLIENAPCIADRPTRSARSWRRSRPRYRG